MDNRLTIGIVSFNSQAVIGQCLTSIRDHYKDTFRVLVIDNDSSDHTHEIISSQFSGVDVINTGGNYGFGYGVNTLLAHSKTPYTLLINADILINETTIEPLIAYLDAHISCIVAAPATYDLEGNLEGNIRIFPSIIRTVATCALGGHRAERLGLCDIKRSKKEYENAHDVDWLKGAIWCLRTDDARLLGGMRADFFLYSEEREFAARALDEGYTSAIVPAAHATHVGGESDFHPPLYALLHINNIRYDQARGHHVSAVITFIMQFLTEGIRSRKAQHRYAFVSHMRALFGIKREATRLIKRIGGITEPVSVQA